MDNRKQFIMNKNKVKRDIYTTGSNDFINIYLNRVQQLLDLMIAANPLRYFLLKNAYKHGFMHELLDPSHCAIGVTI